MFNSLIRFSLSQRLVVVTLSLLLLGLGGWQAATSEIDLFPNLNRPRVVVMTEAPGLAPEEVETLITFPLETSLNGASGVEAVRSSSGVGMSVIYVEFDWGTDIYVDRQIVAERIALAAEQLPEGIRPQLAPIASIMGQIQMIAMWSEDGTTGPLELRTLADWVVRQRLLTIPGIAQVFTMGGGRKQFQVLVNPHSLVQYGVTLHEVKEAIRESNSNATGGYLDQQGPHELLVRALGRVQSVEDLQKLVIQSQGDASITLGQVARIIEGPQVKRGDSAAYVRNEDGGFDGGPAVVLTISKQPDADTRDVSAQIEAALNDLRPTLPPDVRMAAELYSQKAFIDRAIDNVIEALRDGGVLVVIILFLFLMNFRTTFITLTAIPLSLAMTALIFRTWGLSINTMTLGGLAVAIGELVDDAIVDVENIYRRLKENRLAPHPRPTLRVVFDASVEIRSSIVFGTIIVVLVFLPLFALEGMEGRLFAPLGIAYIVSILSSLLVSLTLTPVLSWYLLANRHIWPWVAGGLSLIASSAVVWLWLDAPRFVQAGAALLLAGVFTALLLGVERFSGGEGEGEGPLLRFLKWIAGGVVRFSTRHARPLLAGAFAAVLLAGLAALRLERDFIPPFNEGTVQLNVLLPPGTSLRASTEIAETVDQRVLEIPSVRSVTRRTGRAELDEHAEGVNVSEMIIDLDPDSPLSREELLEQIRDSVAGVPGIVFSVEQPLAHLISHMLSGVKAQIGIKLYGDDLDLLRQKASEMQAAITSVGGVADLLVEPQVIIPQLRVELDRDQLRNYGLRPQDVNEYIATAMNGEVVSQVLEGQRSFDLLVRLDEEYREDRQLLERLSLRLQDGGTIPLSAVASIYESGGPNIINREQVRRRVILQCNVTDRGLVDVVDDIRERLQPIIRTLPAGYFVEFGGQFENQRAAERLIGVLFAASLLGVFLVLYTLFRSANLAMQVLMALPMAFIGSVLALIFTGQTLTIAAMVGFISLGGIASRNGILLLNHYLHLMQYEGERCSREMIVRAGQERLAPVLMTALTSGIGLLPLALSAGEPGKEILYPVATVIIGGLLSSTLLEFLVRPALFWTFGRGAALRYLENADRQDLWSTENEEPRVRPEEPAS